MANVLEHKDAFLQDVSSSLIERMEFGAKKYGDHEIGDPVDHAWEEALDLLFYLWWSRRTGGGFPTRSTSPAVIKLMEGT